MDRKGRAWRERRITSATARERCGPTCKGRCAERWSALKERVKARQRARRGFAEVAIVSARVGDLEGLAVGDAIEVRVEVRLGSLQPTDVRVELVLRHAGENDALHGMILHVLEPAALEPDGTTVFEGWFRAGRSGGFAYGIRVRPAGPDGVADDLGELVLWA